MIESINHRKTIRKYKQQDIDANLLETLLESACRASTMGNMQLYSIIVTKDEYMKEQISPAHFNQSMVKNAPVVLTFCADFNRASQWCRSRDAEPGYNNFLSFINATIDALLVTQTFCTLAEEEGLGICYLGTTIYNPQLIIDVLRLPKQVMPIATVTLGYPDENPTQTDRLPLEAILHKETYHDYNRKDIDRLYAYKESLSENIQFIKENKKETLAQIFTDIRYRQEDNEAMSERLINVLKGQGFW